MHHDDFQAHQELQAFAEGRSYHSPGLGCRHRSYDKPARAKASRLVEVLLDYALATVIAVALAAVLFYGLSS